VGARNNRTLKPKPKVSKMSAAALKKFKKKPCSFCRDKISYIDYKDINLFASTSQIAARSVLAE